MSTSEPPFPKEHSLYRCRDLIQRPPAQQDPSHAADSGRSHGAYSGQDTRTVLRYVPAHPNITSDSPKVAEFLTRELSTTVLDDLHPKLWTVARREGSNVDPLHRQRIKRRAIMVTEEMRLHMVWDSETVFVKPIPLCLLDHDFWRAHLVESSVPSTSQTVAYSNLAPENNWKKALGFLRSYAVLVQHRSDFLIAQEKHLLPEDCQWEEWTRFITHFRDIGDKDVGKRFEYGQLRLSRLNWAVRIYRPSASNERSSKWFYEEPYWSTGPYIRNASLVLVFLFANISLTLSAMQVMLTIPGQAVFAGLASSLLSYSQAFWIFSLVVVLLNAFCLMLLIFIPLLVIFSQLLWGYNHRHR